MSSEQKQNTKIKCIYKLRLLGVTKAHGEKDYSNPSYHRHPNQGTADPGSHLIFSGTHKLGSSMRSPQGSTKP